MKGAGTASVEELWLLPGKAIQRVKWAQIGESTRGVEGPVSWSTDPAMGVMVKRGNSIGHRLHAFGRAAAWREVYCAAKVLAKEKLDGRDHYKVRLGTTENANEIHWVDAATKRVTRIDCKIPDFMGGTLDSSFRMSGFKAPLSLLAVGGTN